MMLALAQSNPPLLALIGSTRENLAKELERMEQQSKLEELSPAQLLSGNREHWTRWLGEYR